MLLPVLATSARASPGNKTASHASPLKKLDLEVTPEPPIQTAFSGIAAARFGPRKERFLAAAPKHRVC